MSVKVAIRGFDVSPSSFVADTVFPYLLAVHFELNLNLVQLPSRLITQLRHHQSKQPD